MEPNRFSGESSILPGNRGFSAVSGQGTHTGASSCVPSEKSPLLGGGTSHQSTSTYAATTPAVMHSPTALLPREGSMSPTSSAASMSSAIAVMGIDNDDHDKLMGDDQWQEGDEMRVYCGYCRLRVIPEIHRREDVCQFALCACVTTLIGCLVVLPLSALSALSTFPSEERPHVLCYFAIAWLILLCILPVACLAIGCLGIYQCCPRCEIQLPNASPLRRVMYYIESC